MATNTSRTSGRVAPARRRMASSATRFSRTRSMLEPDRMPS
jgi:hypothetical protein